MFSNLLFKFAESHHREGMAAGTVTSVTVQFVQPTRFTMGKMVPTENLAYRVYSIPDTIFDSTTLYTADHADVSQGDDGTVSITVNQPNVGEVGDTITAEVQAILVEGEASFDDTVSAMASVSASAGVEVTPTLLGMTSLGSVGTVTVQVSEFQS